MAPDPDVPKAWRAKVACATLPSLDHARHTRKRVFLENLLQSTEIGVLRECRRCPGDLSQLPPSHDYEGKFLPVDSASANSRAGGLVFAVGRSLRPSATGRRFMVHQRGRAATLSLRLGEWVHIDPTLPMSAMGRLLTDIAAHLSRQGGIKSC